MPKIQKRKTKKEKVLEIHRKGCKGKVSFGSEYEVNERRNSQGSIMGAYYCECCGSYHMYTRVKGRDCHKCNLVEYSLYSSAKRKASTADHIYYCDICHRYHIKKKQYQNW